MRKDWRENMVDPPKNCLWIQTVRTGEPYQWETECGNKFQVKQFVKADHFKGKKDRCPVCGGVIHLETRISGR